MGTDETVNILSQVKFIYARNVADILSAGEVARAMAAFDAAVQALETLERVKTDLRGECAACKYSERRFHEPPCRSCIADPTTDAPAWEFRWDGNTKN